VGAEGAQRVECCGESCKVFRYHYWVEARLRGDEKLPRGKRVNWAVD